jgi:hypothetical protein
MGGIWRPQPIRGIWRCGSYPKGSWSIPGEQRTARMVLDSRRSSSHPPRLGGWQPPSRSAHRKASQAPSACGMWKVSTSHEPGPAAQAPRLVQLVVVTPLLVIEGSIEFGYTVNSLHLRSWETEYARCRFEHEQNHISCAGLGLKSFPRRELPSQPPGGPNEHFEPARCNPLSPPAQ